MKLNSLLNVVATCGMSAWLLVLVAGCPSSGPSTVTSPPGETNPPGETQPTDEPHGHSHGADETGPHGGHIVEIGDEQLHAEWTHNDATGTVVVYLLDGSAKSDVAISTGTISITTKIGETEKSYELTAVSREGGQSSQFALSDPSLVEALKAVGPGVEATIVVKMNDEPLVGKFEPHTHGGGHKH